MDQFIIKGPTRLRGSVCINGAKNAVLPIMAASLLARGKSVIENVPTLRDVHTMMKLLEILGAKATLADGVLTIDTTDAKGVEAPYELVRTMRASIYVLAPLLAASGKARVSLPGGCAWGPRPAGTGTRPHSAPGRPRAGGCPSASPSYGPARDPSPYAPRQKRGTAGCWAG